ncbi:MAG: zinc-ribbon domain-containing protein, partial [Archangium sp.]
MKVSCPSCQTNYNIDDKRIPPGGAKLKCARCQNTFPIKADESVSEPAPAAVPLPGPAESAPTHAVSIPVPRAAYRDPAESAPTRAMSIPVPSAAYRDAPPAEAIPLPGAPPSTDYAGTEGGFDYGAPAGEAIPLPGASDPYADNPYASGAPPADAGTVPLPGASDGYAGHSEGFDYAADPYAAAPHADAADPYAA